MPWTYRGLKQLGSYEAYKKELADRLASPEAEKEDIAQKILNEDDDWGAFNAAVDAIEVETRDPEDLDSLDIYREGRRHYRNCYIFKHGPFTVAYFRDPVSRTAIPMVFFHYRDRQKRLQELADLLRESLE
jgi:hypothetical protein